MMSCMVFETLMMKGFGSFADVDTLASMRLKVKEPKWIERLRLA
jgi:hypothetical protein